MFDVIIDLFFLLEMMIIDYVFSHKSEPSSISICYFCFETWLYCLQKSKNSPLNFPSYSPKNVNIFLIRPLAQDHVYYNVILWESSCSIPCTEITKLLRRIIYDKKFPPLSWNSYLSYIALISRRTTERADFPLIWLPLFLHVFICGLLVWAYIIARLVCCGLILCVYFSLNLEMFTV